MVQAYCFTPNHPVVSLLPANHWTFALLQLGIAVSTWQLHQEGQLTAGYHWLLQCITTVLPRRLCHLFPLVISPLRLVGWKWIIIHSGCGGTSWRLLSWSAWQCARGSSVYLSYYIAVHRPLPAEIWPPLRQVWEAGEAVRDKSDPVCLCHDYLHAGKHLGRGGSWGGEGSWGGRERRQNARDLE